MDSRLLRSGIKRLALLFAAIIMISALSVSGLSMPLAKTDAAPAPAPAPASTLASAPTPALSAEQATIPVSYANSSYLQAGTYYLMPAISDSRLVSINGNSSNSKAAAVLKPIDRSNAQKFVVSYNYKSDTYTFKHSGTKQYLTASGKKPANGKSVYQYAKKSTKMQKWAVSVSSVSGAFVVSSAANKKFVLSIKGGKDSDNAKLVLAKKSKTSATKKSFYFYPVSPDTSTTSAGDQLFSIAASGLGGNYLTASDNKLKAAKNNESFAQKFLMVPVQAPVTDEYDDYDGDTIGYALKSKVTGKYLTLASDKSLAFSDASAKTPNAAQTWRFEPTIGGTRIINPATALVLQLDKNKTSLGVSAPADTVRQSFRIFTVEEYSAVMYRLTSVQSGLAATVQNASFMAGKKLQLKKTDKSGAQAWIIDQLYGEVDAEGAPLYLISNEKSGKVLTAAGSTSGSLVKQQVYKGSGATQKWRIDFVGGSTFTIKSAQGNIYLDGKLGGTSSGSNLKLATKSDGKAQQWQLTALTSVKTAGPMDSASYKALYKVAKAQKGKKYSYGASGPKKFDCSGYVYYCFNKSGVKAFWRMPAESLYYGINKIAKSKIKPGDLLFFHNTWDPKRKVDHVGIYIGNNKMINATTTSGVTVTSIGSGYMKSKFYAAGRFS